MKVAQPTTDVVTSAPFCSLSRYAGQTAMGTRDGIVRVKINEGRQP